jgi:hypothetical protein
MGRISAPVVNLSSMSAKQARNTAAVLREIARARARFGVPESAVVFSCYEAGRTASGSIAVIGLIHRNGKRFLTLWA